MGQVMRFLSGLVVGVLGCAVTYLIITKIGPIGEVVLGPTLGLILSIIIVSGGAAVTIALVFAAVKPDKKKSPSGER